MSKNKLELATKMKTSLPESGAAPKVVEKKAESSSDDSSSEDEKDVKKTVVYCLVNWCQE